MRSAQRGHSDRPSGKGWPSLSGVYGQTRGIFLRGRWPPLCAPSEVSELTLWVSRKPQRKCRAREGDFGGGLIHLPLASEVNPCGDLVVEAEDLHGG
jgi:hypothetical protein